MSVLCVCVLHVTVAPGPAMRPTPAHHIAALARLPSTARPLARPQEMTVALFGAAGFRCCSSTSGIDGGSRDDSGRGSGRGSGSGSGSGDEEDDAADEATRRGEGNTNSNSGHNTNRVRVVERVVENRKQGSRMERRFIQATFTYVGGGGASDVDGCSGSSAGFCGGGSGGGASGAALLGSPSAAGEAAGGAAAEAEEEVQVQLGGARLAAACRPAAAWRGGRAGRPWRGRGRVR